MTFSGVRLLVFSLVVMVFYSCQKELQDVPYQFCLLEKVEVFEDTNSLPVESYQYSYHSVNRKPSAITISIPGINFNRVVAIEYSGNTIQLGGVGSIESDGSGKITHLHVESPLPGSPPGDYFFGYNVNGFLEERLYDDGNRVLERTVFKNNGEGLTSFLMQYEWDPAVITGEITYSATPNFENNILLPYGNIFPELVPYFPLIKMGKQSRVPPAKLQVKADRPGFPPLVQEYLYNGYRLNTVAKLERFETEIMEPTRRSISKKFSLSYTCE